MGANLRECFGISDRGDIVGAYLEAMPSPDPYSYYEAGRLRRVPAAPRHVHADRLPVGGWLGIVPADFVMSRDHLHGVEERAEALARSTAVPARSSDLNSSPAFRKSVM